MVPSEGDQTEETSAKTWQVCGHSGAYQVGRPGEQVVMGQVPVGTWRVFWKWMVVVVNTALQMYLMPLSYTKPRYFYLLCQKGKNAA